MRQVLSEPSSIVYFRNFEGIFQNEITLSELEAFKQRQNDGYILHKRRNRIKFNTFYFFIDYQFRVGGLPEGIKSMGEIRIVYSTSSHCKSVDPGI